MSSTFLETADRIAARICRDAIWAGDRCNWIGGYTESASTIVHRALTPDVYSGTSGIALVLLHLFEATGEKIFRLTAEGALRQALGKEAELRAARRFGFFDGLAGVAYVAAMVAHHRDEALRIAGDLPTEESRLDIINGSAGTIAALLALHRQCGADFLLERAVEHANLLVTQANRGADGWSWKTVESGNRDLTGFAHGTAGIAWALLGAFEATGDATLREAAVEGFRYERTHFLPEQQNWPDFRHPGKPAGAVMWCHGAPGIGFSRLRAWKVLGEDVYREEVVTAIRTTSRWLDENPQANFSLCHGRAGNAGLLLYAARELADPDLLAKARSVAEEGIDQYERERVPWPCGVPGGDETHDLMLGLAGIAYFYLQIQAAVNPESAC
ncbi:MAG: lanthionine synthetase LanC family protein [Candidatus Solibacter sp.]